MELTANGTNYFFSPPVPKEVLLAPDAHLLGGFLLDANGVWWCCVKVYKRCVDNRIIFLFSEELTLVDGKE